MRMGMVSDEAAWSARGTATLAGPSVRLISPRNGSDSTYRGGIHETSRVFTCGSGGGTESLVPSCG